MKSMSMLDTVRVLCTAIFAQIYIVQPHSMWLDLVDTYFAACDSQSSILFQQLYVLLLHLTYPLCIA